jgi:protein-tyrosine phosphatase
MNRSGLIMALVLIREGYTADEAINLIRAKRSKHALFNGRFEKWLKEASVEDWRN